MRRRAARILLAAGAVILGLALLFNAALFGAVQWLEGARGQAWLEGRINQALADSGYTADFSSVRYGLNGIIFTDVKIKTGDGAGPLFTADRAALRLKLSALALGRAELSLRAGHAALHRLPESGTEENLRPFAVPDMYMDSFALDLSAKQLDIGAEVFGQPLTLSPRLRAKVDLGETIRLGLAGRVRESPAWMPGKIEMEATLDPRRLEADISRLLIASGAYSLRAEGRAGLGDDGTIMLNLEAQSDLSAFFAGQEGALRASGTLDGALDNPALALQGRVALSSLRERGIPEILFEGNARDLFGVPSGTARLKADYQDMPLTLSSEFFHASPVLTLSGLALSGPDLAATGGMALDTESLLMKGKIHIETEKLETYAALLGQDIGGKAAGDVTLLHHETGSQSAGIAAILRDARFNDYAAARAEVRAVLPDAGNPWPRELALSLRGLRLPGAAAVESFSASLEEADGGYRLAIEGRGTLPQPFTVKGNALLRGLADGAPAARDIDLSLRSRESSLKVTGAAGLAAADIGFAMKNISLGLLPVPQALAGIALTGEGRIEGPLDNPLATAQATLRLPQAGKNTMPRIGLEATLRAGKLYVDMDGSGGGVSRLEGRAELPLVFALRPFAFSLPQEGAVTGQVHADLEAGRLADALLPPGHALAGRVRVNAALSGTVAAPDIGGRVALEAGRYTYLPYNTGLRDIDFAASLSRGSLLIDRMTASDGGTGTLRGEGRIGLREKEDTRLGVNLRDFHLFRGGQIDGTLGADLAVTGAAKGYAVSGTVDAGQFDIFIPDRFATEIPQLNIVKAATGARGRPLQGVSLAINLRAPRRIFVRGWGLDAEFGGNLDVTGMLDAARVDGALQLVRGRYEEFGQRFDLQKADLVFRGAVPPSPYLDVVAVTATEGATISVSLSGTTGKPAVSFSSVPALPQDEILSRLLFGRDMNRITPFQAVQLSNTLRRLSGQGGGGFDPLGRLRSATGLDDIRVETGESGTASVGVGKYLTDKVYIEAEKGGEESSGAATIEIKLKPGLSLESKIGQDAQGGAGIFWSRDY